MCNNSFAEAEAELMVNEVAVILAESCGKESVAMQEME